MRGFGRPPRPRPRAGRSGRCADLGRGHERLPGDPSDGRRAGGRGAATAGRERAAGRRPPGRESRPGEKRRARRRPVSVDGGSVAAERHRCCACIRCCERPERPGGNRHLRTPGGLAHGVLELGRRRECRARRPASRLDAGHRTLGRRRSRGQCARASGSARTRHHRPHRRTGCLQLRVLRRGGGRGAPRACARLHDRHRRARFHTRSVAASRGRHRRCLPGGNLDLPARLGLRLDREQPLAHVAAPLRHGRAAG